MPTLPNTTRSFRVPLLKVRGDIARGGFQEDVMTIPANQFRDPARVYEAKEAQTCKGCQHLDRLWGAEFCGIGVAQGRDNMRKCTRYIGEP